VVFRVKAIEPEIMNLDGMRRTIQQALLNEGADMRSDFEKTTSTWEGEKPTFKPYVATSGGAARVEIEPKGQGVDKWGWLDRGTSSHFVRPKRAKRLRFKTGGKNKTRVGKLQSGPGQRPSGPDRFSKGHRVSGIKARNWSRVIYQNSSIRFLRRMNEAINSRNLYK